MLAYLQPDPLLPRIKSWLPNSITRADTFLEEDSFGSRDTLAIFCTHSEHQNACTKGDLPCCKEM
jgi:hypothetical protein